VPVVNVALISARTQIHGTHLLFALNFQVLIPVVSIDTMDDKSYRQIASDDATFALSSFHRFILSMSV
jgi:hypothetical protein